MRAAIAGLVLLLGAVGLLWPQHVEEVLAAPLYAGVAARQPGALARWLAFDALVNAALFGAFAVALGVLLRRPWWVAALVAAAGGWLVELAQTLLPGRTPDLHDVLSDTVGALVGGLVLLAFERRRRSVRQGAARHRSVARAEAGRRRGRAPYSDGMRIHRAR